MSVRCRHCGGTYVESASAMGEPVVPYCRRCGRQDQAGEVVERALAAMPKERREAVLDRAAQKMLASWGPKNVTPRGPAA